MKIDWAKKLSSRKFWAAVSALVCALCVMFGVDNFTTEKLVATVSALGVLAAYILAEGYVDGKAVGESKDENE